MSQLYSMLDQVSDPDQSHQESKLDVSTNQVTELLDTLSADLDNRIELTSIAIEHAAVAERIQTSLTTLPLGSKEYFACLENNKSVLEILTKRMGVVKVPAIEDFKNEYALRSSHEIALESVSNFFKTTWEAIKKFFKEFFKKIMVFMKRIVHANLELAEYEKYNDQMVAKLKANNAKIADNTPIQTKLAVYLADKGQEKVDSDFVLRNGMNKVVALSGLIDTIGRGDPRFFNKTHLTHFRESLEMVINFYNRKIDGDVSIALTEQIKTIRETAANILTSMFSVTVSDIRSLPESVYEKMFDDFSTANMKSGDVTVLSMVDHTRPISLLPMDTNMFLAHFNNERFFVTGYKETNSYTKPEIPPISNLSNLSKFYDSYKKEVKTANISGCMKSIEAIENEIDRILDILATKYVKLVENVNHSTNLDDLYFRNFFAAIRESGMSGATYKFKYEHDNFDIHELIYQLIELAYLVPITEETMETVRHYKEQRPEILKDAVAYIGKIANLDMKRIYSATEDPEVVSNYKKLQDLNNFLTHVFSKLQTIFRSFVSDIFASYTEIRYEMVRYIYETCRRYSY